MHVTLQSAENQCFIFRRVKGYLFLLLLALQWIFIMDIDIAEGKHWHHDP